MLIMEKRTVKHFFFDLDNTLTRSKSPILPEHAQILLQLSRKAHIIITSGSSHANISERFIIGPQFPFISLSQNGNDARMSDGSQLWLRTLSDEQKQAIYNCIQKMRPYAPPIVSNEYDLIEDRGSQISFSLLGHHEDITKKELFDPEFLKRKKILSELASEIEDLHKTYKIDVVIGGTTTLDFYESGRNKGSNILELCSYMRWDISECLYFGDALFPGGNDYTVVGCIPTHEVDDYVATYAFLKNYL